MTMTDAQAERITKARNLAHKAYDQMVAVLDDTKAEEFGGARSQLEVLRRRLDNLDAALLAAETEGQVT